ncbi:MAG: rhodanese-like domain-containing protein [Planctomycetales bacterium]
MKLRFESACFVVVVACAAVVPAFAAEQTKDSLATVKQKVEAKEAVLVDVREKSEWNAGHVAGAVFLPLSELQGGIDAQKLAERLPKGKILYTHCVVGKRSVTAGNILEKKGYDVRPLKAGYKELLKAGFQAEE